MSTRASNARHVRQRKLNTKQPLRIIREHEIDDAVDDPQQQHITQVETGVEKAEEIEYHLQAAINAQSVATAGTKSKSSYIPTPDAVKAQGVNYDELYPKVFREPATYIRFSSTVEDCVGSSYCMDEGDADFLTQLNQGKSVHGQPLKDKVHCSEDTLEEVLSCFEETSQRLQPFANVNSVPVLPLEELEQAREEPWSTKAQRVIKPVYEYWVSKKGTRPLMPTIKVRVLDTTSEADDADPYVCFRRREVRQTRKTRGRDAQVVEKLKKLRIELEQARNLVQLVREREELNKTNLEVTRKVFEQRKLLKEVKISKNIVGEKGDDEDLLVNQRPQPKQKARQDGRPGPTIRLAGPRGTDRAAPDNDLTQLSDLQAEAELHVQRAIDNKKDQHCRWNKEWRDRTWYPLTPPPDPTEQPARWAPLLPQATGYPTPPPSLPSRSSQDRDGDVEMEEQKPKLEGDNLSGCDTQFRFWCPPSDVADCHADGYACPSENRFKRQRTGNPVCRIRYGRGGRAHLEVRKAGRAAVISRGVVSDSEDESDVEDYHPVSPSKTFDYRVALNNRTQRPEGTQPGRQWPSGDQTAMMASGPAGGTPAPIPPTGAPTVA